MAEHPTKWWVKNRTAPEPEEVEKEPDLDTLTKAELAAMAEAKGLDPSGTKADLLERLTDE